MMLYQWFEGSMNNLLRQRDDRINSGLPNALKKGRLHD
jgi:hypothetical protein